MDGRRLRRRHVYAKTDPRRRDVGGGARRHAQPALDVIEAAVAEHQSPGAAGVAALLRVEVAAAPFAPVAAHLEHIDEVAQELEDEELASEPTADEAETSTPAVSEETASGGSTDDDENH